MTDYENDRWRVISGKVGSGFSAAACRAKAEELEAEEMAVLVDGAAESEDDRSSNDFGESP